MPRQRVLTIEDDSAIRRGIVDALRFAGYETLEAGRGRQGLELATTAEIDLVLLDLVLPECDGMEILGRVRSLRPTLPVIVLTARGDESDRVRGLRDGADDYIVKPFSPAELVARVKSHLARYQRLTGRSRADRWISDGGLEVNIEARRVRKNGREVNLTAKEFDFLLLLIRNPDRAFTRDEIYSRIWGDDLYVDPSTIAVHVRRLREKIEDDPSRPQHVETVWGVGYRWKPRT